MKLFGRRYFHLVKGLTTPENTITYHNALCLSPQNFAEALFSVSPGAISNSQEKLKTILMQNFGVTNKEHYGMLWYFWTKRCSVSQERGKIFTLFFYFIHSCPSFHWLVPGIEIVECGANVAQSPPAPSVFFLLTSLWGPHDLNAYNCIIVACATCRRLEVVGARRTGAQEEDTGVSLSCARSFLRPLLETWKRLRRVWPLCPYVNRDL